MRCSDAGRSSGGPSSSSPTAPTWSWSSTRPPLDPGAAAQAATELLGYCDDTVQDPRTAGDGMVRSTVWLLWWD
ncbi:DUF4253 domain-containing protein [Streptomyces sp. NPDC001876]|uniref:DUF4253 domain-containing protein n=1 Tax=Streptomyces sp. NPDC001876 TaxID=3154402 RepID=UPI00331C5A81